MPGLREIAEADLARTLEDGVTGFGWPITVTNPSGRKSTGLFGQSQDISQVIDPDTGVAVSVRMASVTLRLSSLSAQGLGIPVNIPEEKSKPWVIMFDDISGKAYTFSVIKSMPDRTLGTVTCLLGDYGP